LITTRGFRDTLFIMRGIGRVTGRTPEEMLLLETTRKPEPLVSKPFVREIDERTDWEGEVLVGPDRAQVLARAAELVEAGVDAAERLREEVRQRRLEQATVARPYGGAALAQLGGEVTETLRAGRAEDGTVVLCSAASGEPLCAIGENYKEACGRIDLPVTAASPLASDPATFVDPELQFRLFVCPRTGALIETEIARAGDPVVHEIDLDPAEARAKLL
jgi:hypothetical protein